MLNTSAITVVTKSSMKPQSGITTNVTYVVVEKGMENIGKIKVSFCRTMMRALELQWLAKRHISGQSDIEQGRNQAHSFSGYQVMLV